MTKLHIDLTNGVIEVEGEEELVKIIYADFKDRLAQHKSLPLTKPEQAEETIASQPVSIKKSKKTNHRPVGKSKESYSLIKDLDFKKTDSGVSLKEFYKEKSPTSFAEKNVIFVSYLKNVLKIPKVTLDHVYTCYDEVGSRKPSAFKQSIADTSSKKSWLDTASFDDITVSIRGQNYVDHDLPAKTPEGK